MVRNTGDANAPDTAAGSPGSVGGGGGGGSPGSPQPAVDKGDHDHGHDGHGVHGFTGKWKDTIESTWSAVVPNEFESVTAFAKYMPLIAAIIAPTSTLLDVPALTVSKTTDCG